MKRKTDKSPVTCRIPPDLSIFDFKDVSLESVINDQGGLISIKIQLMSIKSNYFLLIVKSKYTS